MWDADAEPFQETESQRTARHRIAVESCRQCPILSACERCAAVEKRPTGVWAGIVYPGETNFIEEAAPVVASEEGENESGRFTKKLEAHSPNEAFDVLIATIRAQHRIRSSEEATA
ncbi:hypothetical protein BH92_26630 (plasmid) [Rhodococcoides fascians A21d2]|nr:hypothetical protein BH92_26630 [Rhodococcus fascians A21d2]